MALVFAVLIEAATIACSAGILFAGMMRATGSTGADQRSAALLWSFGTSIAALVAISHFVGW